MLCSISSAAIMHLQAKLLITLFLASVILGVVSGTMLKCGEDIIVGRGERKTLKFWSAEDDLLKVQLVSAPEIHQRRPPGGVISYSKIPGLSEAILAHTKNKLSPGGGLHYAGNPDIAIDHVFQNDESSYDDYYTFSKQSNDSQLTDADYPSNLLQESGENFSTTETMSDFVDTTVSEELQTTTGVHTPITTTQSSTTQGMKLVTFFPDLQHYTRGDTINANTRLENEDAETSLENVANDNSFTDEHINKESFQSTADNTNIDFGAEDLPGTIKEAVVVESQTSIDDEINRDMALSNETENELSATVQSVLFEDSEENLGDTLLAILNGHHEPLEVTNTEISSSDTSGTTDTEEHTHVVDGLSGELGFSGVLPNFQEEEDTSKYSVLDEESQTREDQGSESYDESGTIDLLPLGPTDDVISSENPENFSIVLTTEVPVASEVVSRTENNVPESSVNTESSYFEKDSSNSLSSTTQSTMDAQFTSGSGFTISDNLITERTFDGEGTITDKFASQVIETAEIEEHGSEKFKVDSKNKVAIYSDTESSDDSEFENVTEVKTEEAAGEEKNPLNVSVTAVTESSEQQSQFLTSGNDESVTDAIGELTTVLPDEVTGETVDDVLAVEQRTHDTSDLALPDAEFSSAESLGDQTTPLDELLRESFADILTNIDAEKTTVEESAKEAPVNEISDSEDPTVDSIDDMEKIMSTLSDDSLFSQAPPLRPETTYHNIKHISMAGHQNHYENAVVNNHEYLLRQEDIPLNEETENSILLKIHLQNNSDSISSTSLEDISTVNSNRSDVKDLEVKSPTQLQNITEVKSSNNELSFTTQSAAEFGENVTDSLLENTSQPQTVTDNIVQIIQENEILELKDEEVVSDSSRPLDISLSSDFTTSGAVDSEVHQSAMGEEATEADIGIQTTTDSHLDTTDATSEVPDEFKGYEYYENLYDSLMPQKQTEGKIGIDDLLAQSGNVSKVDPEFAPLDDFDTDILPEVDYDATKATIPQTSIDNGSQPLDPNDIEQARVPLPDWKPANDELPKNVEDLATAGEIESFGEGNETISDGGGIIFNSDSPDYEQTKQDIPIEAISSDLTDSMKDIYQIRVKGPSLNTVRDSIKLNSVNDIDLSQNPILSQEIPYAKTDGREKVQNDILNSIASIIKDTIDSTDGNAVTITESISSIDTTAKIPDTQEYDDAPHISGNADKRNGEDSNASELIEIPLEIVNGEVKVSQNQPTSSLSVPLSALESEETFDNYLRNHLVNGSHVLRLDTGEKVPVQSFDELTTALKSDQGNSDFVAGGKDNVQVNVDEELSEISGQSDVEPQTPDEADETNDRVLVDGSNLSLDIEVDSDGNQQTQSEKFTGENGDEESERILEENVEAFSPPDITEEHDETDLQSDADPEVSFDDILEELESEARDDSSFSENDMISVVSEYNLETSTMNVDVVTAHVEGNSLVGATSKPPESTEGSKNVIDILEDMLFNDPNLDKLITEEKKVRTDNITETHLDESSKSEQDKIANFGDEITNTTQASNGEASTEASQSLHYSNDFDLSSLRVAESEYKSSENERPQWQLRKPARKDDSGFEFGGDTPFLMRLPGSPNPGLVYIQYEPVQVKYVPAEGFDSNANNNGLTNEDEIQFAKRTGIEQELNAIETDVLLNNTAASTHTSEAQHKPLEGLKETDASKGIYQMIGNVIPHYDYDVDSNQNFDVESSTEGTHAHIDIPLSFISQEPAYKEVPDPFVVMPPPDLTSQELVNPDDPAQSMYSHVIEPHAEYQSGNLDPLILQREKAEENLISGGEVEVGKPEDEMLEPGKYYSSEHRGTIYGDVDLERLNNPVFRLQTKLHRPTADELMNPSFTPFPITTNPPREILTTQVAKKASSTSPEITEEIDELRPGINEVGNSKELNASSVDYDSASSAALLVSNDDASVNDIFSDSRVGTDQNSLKNGGASFKEPESVGYSSPPAVDFRLSYNPSDMPKFMRENPNAFPSWYPQGNDGNNFRAEALTAEENTPLGSHRDATQEISGKNFADFENPNSEFKESARHSGNAFTRESRWPSNEKNHYGAFYHPADIPGVMMADLTRRHLSLPGNSQESRSSGLPWYKSHSNSASEVEGGSALKNDPSAPLIFGPTFFKYLNSLPVPLLRDFLEPSPSERAVRMRRTAEQHHDQIYCEWNIKTEPGLFLLMHFQNLSAPYSVDCHGAYIEVERENNGYDARYCGNRVAHMGNRPHVIFAKSEVRITVYDDGGAGKSKPTGFDADIDVIDLFNPNEYSAFMESNSYPHIRRLLNG